MLGEHGDAQVPVWSSVQVHGMDAAELAQTVARLRHGATPEDFAAIVARERQAVTELLKPGGSPRRSTRVDTLAPDVRVIVKPYVTHLSGSKTVLATANVTVDLVSTLLDGREVLVAGQAMLEGDFYGMHGPLGVPVVAGANGISRVVEIPLDDAEHAQLAAISQAADRPGANGGWHAVPSQPLSLAMDPDPRPRATRSCSSSRISPAAWRSSPRRSPTGGCRWRVRWATTARSTRRVGPRCS